MSIENRIEKILIFFSIKINACLLLIFISLLLCFVRFYPHPIQDWDEARQGINAIEMLQNHDYFNLYFDNKIDTWNAKPPLMIWAIALSYKFFDVNELALRLPAMICGILYLLVTYHLITKYKSPLFSLMVCLALCFSKALFWEHLAITGDFDAMLLLWLNLSLYFFLNYIDFNKKWSILFCFIFSGLAFYTKGPAGIVFFPSFLIYVIYRKKLLAVLSDYRLYLGVLVYILIVGSWIYISMIYGVKFEGKTAYQNSSSSLSVLFYNDVIGRFLGNAVKSDGFENTHDYFFLFHVLDVKLNMWNYLFYISLGYILYQYFYLKKALIEKSKLIEIAILFTLPLLVFLTFATNVYDWYFAPCFFLILCFTFIGLEKLIKSNLILQKALILLFIFTGIRHLHLVAFQEPTAELTFIKQNFTKLKNANKIIMKDFSQSLYFYLKKDFINIEINDKKTVKNEIYSKQTCIIEKAGNDFIIK